MTINIGIKTLPQPTNLQAVAVAGGSLAPDTTYYYKVLAADQSAGIYTFGPRSATANATTTSENKTIALTWDDMGIDFGGGYSGYFILRSTTNDFSDTQKILLTIGNRPEHPTAPAYNDNGTTNPLGFINWKGGLPTIWANSTEQMTMNDLYAEDQAQGWGRVLPSFSTDFIDFDPTFQDEGVCYHVHANLALGRDADGNEVEVDFYHVQAPLVIFGALRSSASSTIQIGQSRNSGKSCSMWRRVQVLTHGSGVLSVSALYGVLKLYGMSLTIGGYTLWGAYSYLGWNNPYSGPGITGSAGSEVIDCDFFPRGNGYGIGGEFDIFRGCRFGGCLCNTHDATLVGVTTTDTEGLGCRHIRNPVFVDPINYYSSYDVIWHTSNSAFVENPTFDSKDQSTTTNHPYIHLAYGNALNGSFTFATTLRLIVQDVTGAPISGATVTVIDANGYSALFADSGATLSETMSAGETGMDVSDGTKFSVGDFIRLEYASEIMQVAEIAGNTLTVLRGLRGTTDAQYLRDGDKLLVQVDSVVTDVDGIADCGKMFRYVLYPTEQIDGEWSVSAAYPATHVANGWLVQVDHTPHTVTIKKAGYRTRTAVWTMSKKRDEIETLEVFAPITDTIDISVTETESLVGEVTEDQVQGNVAGDTIRGDVTESDVVAGNIAEDTIAGNVED